MINRRQFSKGIAFSSLAASLPLTSAAATHSSAHIASAGKDRAGKYWLSIMGIEQGENFQVALPARAHDVVFHPQEPWVIVTARRPGYYLLLVNYITGKVISEIHPADGFHFYGHTVFSADGKTLFTTENEIATGQGKIIARSLSAPSSITAQFDSFGIGPHQLKLMPDQETLVVANGGILTDPAHERKKLNIATMEPSLAYINSQTGQLIEQVKLPPEYHKLSIRHLDVNADGLVAFGMQYQGEVFDDVPLVATHHYQQGQTIHLHHAPAVVNRKMKQYTGSVCFDRSGRYAMISCPRGNLVTLWDMETQQFIKEVRCKDGCGVASTQAGEFLISSGFGKIYRHDMISGTTTPLAMSLSGPMAWDNHMTVI